MIDAAFSLTPARKSVDSTIRLPCSISGRGICVIARPDTTWLYKQSKLVTLCVVLVLCGGCDSGGDRLNELVPAFSLQREGLNEAKQLIQALAATEGISGFVVGALYNDTPDRVRYPREIPFPLEPVETISLKDPQSKAKLERLRAVARKLSCEEVTVDGLGQVRVFMYSGRNTDYGYEFFDRSGTQTLKDGDYLEIPGEKNWYAFRR